MTFNLELSWSIFEMNGFHLMAFLRLQLLLQGPNPTRSKFWNDWQLILMRKQKKDLDSHTGIEIVLIIGSAIDNDKTLMYSQPWFQGLLISSSSQPSMSVNDWFISLFLPLSHSVLRRSSSVSLLMDYRILEDPVILEDLTNLEPSIQSFEPS